MPVFLTPEETAALQPDAPRQCPRCGSTQIHAGRRGFSFLLGIFGMNRIILTCLKCGHRFEIR
jgi:DNA-directed RNA polymerase subunit RPC12/RpoP